MTSWLQACKTAWELLRDVGFTGFGAWIVYHEVAGTHPWLPGLVGGGVLMVPAARANFLALVMFVTGQSSWSAQPPGERSPGPSSRAGGTGE